MNGTILKKLPSAAEAVVRKAMRSGAFDDGLLTMGEARRLVAIELGLEEGALDAKDIRKQVKDAVNVAIDAYDDDAKEEPETPVKHVKGKRKSRGTSDSPFEVDTSPVAPAVKPKSKAKSKETVESDEEEDADEPASPASSMSSVYDEPPPPKKSKAKKRADPDDDASPAKPASRKGKRKSEVISDPEDDEGGDVAPPSPASSAMSSVYDEPPKPKKTKTTTAKGAKGRTKKDPNEGLSPDEAKLADLKRIVVACGVRKQWTKEFADYPSIREQIRHVQDMLRDLGMKGNPTLGKAKSLKARRELAQELSDVREFEEGHGLSADRPTRSRAARGTRETTPPPPDEDGAMAAVMDFLGDDSD